jgi:hypothetical protein
LHALAWFVAVALAVYIIWSASNTAVRGVLVFLSLLGICAAQLFSLAYSASGSFEGSAKKSVKRAAKREAKKHAKPK